MSTAIPEERVQKGIRRLLEAPLTLKSCGAPIPEFMPWTGGSNAHRELFDEYREEVDYVAEVALQWWEETLRARTQLSPNEKQAVRKAWIDRPAGPASYPGLVALVRDYWLACHRLNIQLKADQQVPPWTFLLAWMLVGDYQQTVSVLACMPYWPIGLDQEGSWV